MLSSRESGDRSRISTDNDGAARRILTSSAAGTILSRLLESGPATAFVGSVLAMAC